MIKKELEENRKIPSKLNSRFNIWPRKFYYCYWDEAFCMDPANAFSSLQPSCNQGSTEKKQDSQADATAARETSALPSTHTCTPTHTRALSQMGEGKAVALPT